MALSIALPGGACGAAPVSLKRDRSCTAPSRRTAVKAAYSNSQLWSTLCTYSVSPAPRIPTSDAEPTLPLLDAGSFLGRFTSLKVVGQGTFATVHVVYDQERGQHYAAKVLDTYRAGQKRLDVIEREVALWKRAQANDSIVKLEEVYREPDHVYIVQELCRGGDLSHYLQSMGRISEEHAASILQSAFRALASCHDRGVLHGDIKPGNFLFKSVVSPALSSLDSLVPERISPDNLKVKLADFGCSQLCDGSGKCSDKKMSGTPAYMAPEVIQRDYGLPCDVWSLGVVMYHLLTGGLPFWEGGLPQVRQRPVRLVMKDILYRPVEVDSPQCHHLSEEARDLMARLLVKDPALRISAADALDHAWFTRWCS